jgi:pimeloyl-ACP methyl ester carboxylesterase
MTSYDQNQLPHYERRPGIGPALVFLHYWGGSGRTWAPVISALPGRDALTLDFRGWGHSHTLPGPYDLRRLAADTRAVLRAAGVSEFVLVGHSMGGKVAQLVAATKPDGLRGLVLVAPAPARPAASIDAQYRAGLSHAYDSAEAVADARDTVLTATELPAALRAQIVEDSLASTPAARAEWPLRGIADDICAETQRITARTLVIAGEHDQVEPAEILRTNLLPYLGDAELTVVPGSGHLIPLEAPEALAVLISGFPPAWSPFTSAPATSP